MHFPFKYNYIVAEGAVMFPTSTVGRKIMMALTGQFMIIYVLAHVLGNSTIYSGAINSYAEGLRHWPFVLVLWSSRFLLFLSLALHSFYGVVIKLENRRAKPGSYSVTNYQSATFAGRTMIWTGIVIGSYLIYHLLHFTYQVIDPSVAATAHPDVLGRPDVLMMVVRSFQNPGIVIIYLVGVTSLLLHLMHGIQSSFQTWGMNNDRTLPLIVKAGLAAATVLFIGYAAIPITIIFGILKG